MTAGMLSLEGKRSLVVGDNEQALAIERLFLRAGGAVARAIDSPDRLSADSGVARIVKTAERQLGYIDILVHSWDHVVEAPAIEMNASEWKQALQRNVKSKFLFAKYCGQSMLQRSNGNVIFIVSIAGQVALQGSAAMAAGCGAVQQIVRTLGVEWAARGIRANTVAASVPIRSANGCSIESLTPMGKLPNADDIAGCALYLACDLSRMMTGQIITVDGGYVAI